MSENEAPPERQPHPGKLCPTNLQVYLRQLPRRQQVESFAPVPPKRRRSVLASKLFVTNLYKMLEVS